MVIGAFDAAMLNNYIITLTTTKPDYAYPCYRFVILLRGVVKDMFTILRSSLMD